jgi:ribosomal protein S18 acetylase RimI-like enzyme
MPALSQAAVGLRPAAILAAKRMRLDQHPDVSFSVAERSTKHEDALVDLFYTLKVEEEEIRAAIRGKSHQGETTLYEYQQSFVPMILHTQSNTVASAAIVVKKEVRQHIVFELIWFATSPEHQGRGYGDKLFRLIR